MPDPSPQQQQQMGPCLDTSTAPSGMVFTCSRESGHYGPHQERDGPSWQHHDAPSSARGQESGGGEAISLGDGSDFEPPYAPCSTCCEPIDLRQSRTFYGEPGRYFHKRACKLSDGAFRLHLRAEHFRTQLATLTQRAEAAEQEKARFVNEAAEAGRLDEESIRRLEAENQRLRGVINESYMDLACPDGHGVIERVRHRLLNATPLALDTTTTTTTIAQESVMMAPQMHQDS